MDLKVIGSSPVIYPLILNEEFLDKKSIFYYEGYKWDFTIDLIFDVDTSSINKNNNLLCLKYSDSLHNVLSIFRKTTDISENSLYNHNWYYIYYINNLFSNNLTDSYNKNLFEKYNIITINCKSKQFRFNIISFKNKIYNLTVGRVLSSLNMLEKSKKKSNKGERLFIEYLNNFLNLNKKNFGLSKLSILKIKNSRTKFKLNNSFFKILNLNFNITKIIYDYKLPNNYSKFKKVRSIKKRIKKKIIKMENIINL